MAVRIIYAFGLEHEMHGVQPLWNFCCIVQHDLTLVSKPSKLSNLIDLDATFTSYLIIVLKYFENFDIQNRL